MKDPCGCKDDKKYPPVYPFPGEIEISEQYWNQINDNKYQVVKYCDGRYQITVNDEIQYKIINVRYSYYKREPLEFKTLADARLALARIKAKDYQSFKESEQRYKQMKLQSKIAKTIPLHERISLGHQCP